ncbi:MAG TPA: MFS transporter [Burkholderiales bacterium]|jgi:MHS family proline/betaine transporter-like MFS transporter|nr:MFS transporter [Burkholderiales bacterium]
MTDKQAMDKPERRETRRAVTAAVVGNVLEWYDFAIYAYMATVIARKFFPSGNEVSALLSTFAAFGVGFVLRPLGGILIGRLGDLKGRKTALLLTIALMAAGTVLIGLIPSYETVGPAAPILIVIARMLQGFSAGGEWGGSTAFIVEWAPENQRGFYGSLQQCSVAGGLLLGSAVAALVSSVLPAQTVDDWAWRIPFLLGGLLGPVGLYMRRNIGETPAFARAQETTSAATSDTPAPAWLAARAFGFTILWSVSYYIVLAYMPTFLQRHVMLGRSEALWATTAGLLVLVTTIPLSGLLSDRFGRKPLLLAACVAFMVLPYPLFDLMLVGASLGTIIAIQVALALGIALYSGPGPAAIAEIFPTKGRSTWMSTGYSLSVAVFGGFAPFVATWLIEKTGSLLSPAYYLMAAAAASTVVVLRLEESADKPLR